MNAPLNPADKSSASPANLNEQALAWLERREAGAEAVEAEYQAWLRADPCHRAAVDALRPGWTAINHPRRAGQGEALRAQVGSIIARRRRRRTMTVLSGLAAAAVITFVVRWPAPIRESVPSDASARATIAIRPDRQRLPDGTLVELNADTEITIDFTAAARSVRLLRGEALFVVAKEARRPFLVTADTFRVRAVGTQFSVRLAPDALGVLVTEGRVALEPPAVQPSPDSAAVAAPTSEPVLIDAGARVVVARDVVSGPAVRPQPVTANQVAAALAWRTQRVEFNATPLAEAVRLFNQENALQLHLADTETGSLRITGVFWTSDPAAFARALATSLELKATRENQRIVLSCVQLE
jgi:transmembrane sensor